MVPQLVPIPLLAAFRLSVAARSDNPALSTLSSSARQCISTVGHREAMLHMHKPSNTHSTPAVFSTKTRDTSTSNHASSTSTAKLPKSSTKPYFRRARPSIDKTQVSKPFPILAYDERELFDAMATSNFQDRARRIPKAAEKKVRINAPESTKPSRQPEPKASANVPSQSWYTPSPAQHPTTATLQQSTSNGIPRTKPSKVDRGRANSPKDFKSHGRNDSEVRRDGVEPAKRRVQKKLITHPDCPWVESTRDRPIRSATQGSYESDKTAVEDAAPTCGDGEKEEEAMPLAKSAQETLRPVVMDVSKPLPDLPASDSVSSRWSVSTGSVYSDDDPFSRDHILSMFPKPPNEMPNVDHFNDWERSHCLSTPPAFMSCPNTSSSSIATITPTTVPDPTVKPTLKAVPKSKVATVVHQIPRISIIIQKDRACPLKSVEGSIYTSSIQTTDAAPTLRPRSSSFTSSQSQNPPRRVANIEALVWPHIRQTAEDIERIERERLERERKWQIEEQEEEERKLFEREFGFNPLYEGKKMYQREVDPNGVGLFRPEKLPKWV